MTQTAFGKLLGVTHASVSGWETGKLAPSTETFIKLGNLAEHPAAVFWFWEQGGVDLKKLMATFGEFIRIRDIEKGKREISMELVNDMFGIPPNEAVRLVKTGKIRGRKVSGIYLLNYYSVLSYVLSNKEFSKVEK